MERPATTRTALVLPWATILKIILALVLVWVVLRLSSLLLAVVIAALLAVTLEPIVLWLERHRLPRALAAIGLAFVLVAVVGGLVWAAIPEATAQSQLVFQHLSAAAAGIERRLPQSLGKALQEGANGQSGVSTALARAPQIGAGVVRGIAAAVLVLALMLYLLIDGQRTYAYLLAYVPRDRRARVVETAIEVRRIISAYVAGNLLTSVLAAAFVFVVLTILKVPAALVLALLAGLFDFLPVVGFILSLAPALLLAFTVSPAAALTVAALYVAYHLLESYYITPKVYGSRLRLSDLAVLLAFALGFELGGVIGAILALPIVAGYPAVERIWLADRLGRDVVREHEKIAAVSSG